MKTLKLEKTINIYKFEELNESIKETKLDAYSHDMQDINNDLFEDMLREELSEQFGNEFDFSYSLGYCQGDGLCIYSKNRDNLPQSFMNYNNMIDNVFTKDEQETIHNDIEDGLISTRLYKHNHQYSHNLTVEAIVSIDVLDYDDNRFDYVEKLSQLLNDIKDTICDKYEDLGYKIIYHQTTEDEYTEVLECDDMNYFDINGNMIDLDDYTVTII